MLPWIPNVELGVHATRYPVVAHSTAYCQAGRTASGRSTRWGLVAQNTLKFGTRIILSRPIRGRRQFTVADHIGWGSELDVFMTSCAAALQYGRRIVHYRVATGGAR